MRIFYVNDGVPHTTTSSLRWACARRGVEFVEIDARRFDFHPERQLDPGDLLYRAGISDLAERVEQFLFTPGVATFYADAAGPWFSYNDSILLFTRAGVTIPRTVRLLSKNRDWLRQTAADLGGLPLVLKMPGYSRGVGVIKVESFASLFSLADLMIEEGRSPLLTSFIADATHWRVVVVGGRAVAHYRNVFEQDDFRTHGSDDPADFAVPLPPGMEQLAVQAVDCLRFEYGGVDILEHPSGRQYVLECNFPAYFSHAQEVAGVDVGMAMVDYLIAKAHRIAGVAVASTSLPARLPGELQMLSERPRILLQDGFLSDAEINYVLSLTAAGTDGGVTADFTGASVELPVAGDFGLEAILKKVREAIGIPDGITNPTFRYRRYAPGNWHPPHLDDYEIGELRLAATAILYLNDVERGGETRFPAAGVTIAPRRGRLGLWFNLLPDGSADPATLHESAAVEAGEKVTLTYFLYAAAPSGTA